jgi:hypothetical protein
MDRDGWKCVACGNSDTTLHVHHLYYDGQPWEVPDDALQTICESCHALLGQHPKGGVHWFLDDSQKPVVGISWCPQCGGFRFDDKSEYGNCIACGWTTKAIDATCVPYGDRIEFAENTKPNNGNFAPGSYGFLVDTSSKLRELIAEIRRAGLSDAWICNHIWPDFTDIAWYVRMRTDCANGNLHKDLFEAQQEFEDVLLKNIVQLRRHFLNGSANS